jgi:hypothetical protein
MPQSSSRKSALFPGLPLAPITASPEERPRAQKTRTTENWAAGAFRMGGQSLAHSYTRLGEFCRLARPPWTSQGYRGRLC